MSVPVRDVRLTRIGRRLAVKVIQVIFVRVWRRFRRLVLEDWGMLGRVAGRHRG